MAVALCCAAIAWTVPFGDAPKAGNTTVISASQPDQTWLMERLGILLARAADARGGPDWHLRRANFPVALSPADADGTVIAVIDSGVDVHHPALEGALVPGWNFIDDNDDVRDDRGHGTAVASVIALAAQQVLGQLLPEGDLHPPGPSIKGKFIKIMPLKVARTDGICDQVAAARAILHAADQGVKIVNLSYAGVHASPVLREAAAYLRARGGILVVAAGNRGHRLDPGTRVKGLVTVGATTMLDARARFSNTGAQITLSAPGVSIPAAVQGTRGYERMTGTSFAAPLVTAALGLMLAVAPQTPADQALQALTESARDLGPPGADEEYGHGLLDVKQALRRLSALRAADPENSQAVQSPPDQGVHTASRIRYNHE